jgi:hypothetical protein
MLNSAFVQPQGQAQIFEEQNKVILILRLKGHSMTCRCRHRGRWRYGSNPFATSALEAGRWLAPHSCRFTFGNDPVIRWTRGWVSLRAGLDGHGKSLLIRDSISESSGPKSVTILTALSSLSLLCNDENYFRKSRSSHLQSPDCKLVVFGLGYWEDILGTKHFVNFFDTGTVKWKQQQL